MTQYFIDYALNFGYNLVSGDFVHVTMDGTAYRTSASTFYGSTGVSSVNISIIGDVYNTGNAIELLGQSVSYDQASSQRIQIGSSSNVTAGTGKAIFLGGSDNRVTNAGNISSNANTAVQFHSNSGSGNYLNNSGTISSNTGYGVHFLNSGSSYSYGSFTNTGTVTGYLIGVYFEETIADAFINHGTIIGHESKGLVLGTSGSGGISYVTNTGDIIGVGGMQVTGVYGLELNNSGNIINTWLAADRYAIDASTLTTIAKIVNSGSVEGNVITGSGIDTLTNTGTISGNIKLGTSGDTLKNIGGTINGNVMLGDGNDIFDGRGGVVTGDVAGGLGDDTYYVSQSNISLVENAAEGTDSVLSTVTFVLSDNFENLELIGNANVAAVGNAEDNTLLGNAGNNWMRGVGGNDFIAGKSGDDVVLGGAGWDSLYGGEDNDRLYGGTGNDKLYGGNDTDILHGGLGADLLFGGNGSDTFEFTRAAQSLKTNADTIKDFQKGSDAIDISAFGANFLGTAAYTGTQAEVRVTATATNSTVWIDTDGNGFADMKILVEGVVGITVGDFIL